MGSKRSGDVRRELQVVLARLVSDRDALNATIRGVRETLNRLERQKRTTEKAKGTPAFKVLQASLTSLETEATELLDVLVTVSGSEAPVVFTVPEPTADDQSSLADHGSQEDPPKPARRRRGQTSSSPIGEGRKKERKERWSIVAKQVIEGAARVDEFPQSWDALMVAGYGPQWGQLRLTEIPGRWGSHADLTLQEELSTPESMVRRTILNGLQLLDDHINGRKPRVTSDIEHVASLVKQIPDFNARICTLRISQRSTS